MHHHLKAFAATSTARCSAHYFRSVSGDECDFVLDDRKLVPMELKTSHTPRPRDTAGLRVFMDLFPKQAPFGLLLYPGTEVVPLADRVVAVPLSAFLAGPPAIS